MDYADMIAHFKFYNMKRIMAFDLFLAEMHQELCATNANGISEDCFIQAACEQYKVSAEFVIGSIERIPARLEWKRLYGQ
jgi:hypothetical protein